jgi:glycosyltransferase involved in cell wall biosynthesis
VTLVDAMSLGRPVVATRCIGTEDYVQSGETGTLVQPGSLEDMSGAIERLWHDEPLRQRLGRGARSFALRHCSDEAAGRSLKRVLDTVAGSGEDDGGPVYPKVPPAITRRAA